VGVLEDVMAKRVKQTKDTWPGAKTLYGRWNTNDDPGSPYLESYDDRAMLHGMDGEIVGVYELVSVQRIEVRPALVELAPVSRRRRKTSR
jgi:hypothetical protein